jgi:hypothetical protein
LVEHAKAGITREVGNFQSSCRLNVAFMRPF